MTKCSVTVKLSITSTTIIGVILMLCSIALSWITKEPIYFEIGIPSAVFMITGRVLGAAISKNKSNEFESNT